MVNPFSAEHGRWKRHLVSRISSYLSISYMTHHNKYIRPKAFEIPIKNINKYLKATLTNLFLGIRHEGNRHLCRVCAVINHNMPTKSQWLLLTWYLDPAAPERSATSGSQGLLSSLKRQSSPHFKAGEERLLISKLPLLIFEKFNHAFF